jgi:predicted Mrr-cat superfamily restriction endonuclease
LNKLITPIPGRETNAKLQPRDASLKTGLLFRFTNSTKIGDYCFVPYEDVLYVAIIKSEYYFDPASVTFEHQRKVEWLFETEPFGREELPKEIQTSLKSKLGLTDMSQHESLFKNYLMKKQKGGNLEDPEKESMADEMNSRQLHLKQHNKASPLMPTCPGRYAQN